MSDHMRGVILFIVCLLIPIQTVAASRWVKAGQVGRNTILIDMDSLHRAGQEQLEVWINYKNAMPDENGVSETLVYEHLHCDTNMHATISLMAYSKDGKVLSESEGRSEDVLPIVPDSILSRIMPFICAAGGMPQS